MHHPTNLGASNQRSLWRRLHIYRDCLSQSPRDKDFIDSVGSLRFRAHLQSDRRLLGATDAFVHSDRGGSDSGRSR